MKVRDESDKFEVTLDVSQYKPEELKVTTNNHILCIEGTHATESGNPAANQSATTMKQFSRYKVNLGLET